MAANTDITKQEVQYRYNKEYTFSTQVYPRGDVPLYATERKKEHYTHMPDFVGKDSLAGLRMTAKDLARTDIYVVKEDDFCSIADLDGNKENAELGKIYILGNCYLLRQADGTLCEGIFPPNVDVKNLPDVLSYLRPKLISLKAKMSPDFLNRIKNDIEHVGVKEDESALRALFPLMHERLLTFLICDLHQNGLIKQPILQFIKVQILQSELGLSVALSDNSDADSGQINPWHVEILISKDGKSFSMNICASIDSFQDMLDPKKIIRNDILTVYAKMSFSVDDSEEIAAGDLKVSLKTNDLRVSQSLDAKKALINGSGKISYVPKGKEEADPIEEEQKGHTKAYERYLRFMRGYTNQIPGSTIFANRNGIGNKSVALEAEFRERRFLLDYERYTGPKSDFRIIEDYEAKKLGEQLRDIISPDQWSASESSSPSLSDVYNEIPHVDEQEYKEAVQRFNIEIALPEQIAQQNRCLENVNKKISQLEGIEKDIDNLAEISLDKSSQKPSLFSTLPLPFSKSKAAKALTAEATAKTRKLKSINDAICKNNKEYEALKTKATEFWQDMETLRNEPEKKEEFNAKENEYKEIVQKRDALKSKICSTEGRRLEVARQLEENKAERERILAEIREFERDLELAKKGPNHPDNAKEKEKEEYAIVDIKDTNGPQPSVPASSNGPTHEVKLAGYDEDLIQKLVNEIADFAQDYPVASKHFRENLLRQERDKTIKNLEAEMEEEIEQKRSVMPVEDVEEIEECVGSIAEIYHRNIREQIKRNLKDEAVSKTSKEVCLSWLAAEEECIERNITANIDAITETAEQNAQQAAKNFWDKQTILHQALVDITNQESRKPKKEALSHLQQEVSRLSEEKPKELLDAQIAILHNSLHNFSNQKEMWEVKRKPAIFGVTDNIGVGIFLGVLTVATGGIVGIGLLVANAVMNDRRERELQIKNEAKQAFMNEELKKMKGAGIKLPEGINFNNFEQTLIEKIESNSSSIERMNQSRDQVVTMDKKHENDPSLALSPQRHPGSETQPVPDHFGDNPVAFFAHPSGSVVGQRSLVNGKSIKADFRRVTPVGLSKD